jgi:predicted  nucleic acid-binding Zn-ribbon protein
MGAKTTGAAAGQAETERLRALVGPDARSYEQLRLEWLTMREATIAAELRLGEALGQVRALQTQVDRLRRDHQWLRSKAKGIVRRVPGAHRAAARLRR